MPQRRDLPLVEAHIRRAPHADATAAPGLPTNPVQGVVAVHAIMDPRREQFALRAEAATTVLGDDGVPALSEVHAQTREPIGRCLVWSATQNNRRGRYSGGQIYVGGKVDAIAHRHALIAQHADSRHTSYARIRRGLSTRIVVMSASDTPADRSAGTNDVSMWS